MGKGTSSSASDALKSMAGVAGQQQDLSKQLLSTYQPYAKAAGTAYSNILSGGPELQKTMGPALNQTAQQYGALRKSAMEMPQGGARDSLLKQIGLGQAGTKSQIYTGGIDQAIAALANLGVGGTQQGLGALSGAGGTYGGAGQGFMNLSQLQGQQWSEGMKGVGALAAMI